MAQKICCNKVSNGKDVGLDVFFKKSKNIVSKHYDELDNFHVNSIAFTDCEGNPDPVYLEKGDLLTVTVCGTEKTPCPKTATYTHQNSILKIIPL